MGRDTLIYGVGFVVQRATSLIMLPIFTRCLTPTEYGVLHLLAMSLDVASILLAAGVTAGVFRFYFKTDDARERRGVMFAAWAMMLAFNILGAGALWALATPIAEHVLKDAGSANLVRIVACSFAIDPLVTVAMLYLQVLQKARAYTAISIGRVLIQLGLNIWLVVFLGKAVWGVVVGTLATLIILAIPLSVWFLRRTGATFARWAFGALFWFGLPYRVSAMGAFILAYVDRYFLNETHGTDVVGVYSLAYQFGFVVGSLSVAPFLLAWDPRRFKMAKRPRAERDAFYNRGFLALSVLAISVTVGISLLVTPTLVVIANPAYHGAAVLVPLIMLAYVFQGWTLVFEFGIQVSERTRFAAWATWIGVAVVIAGYAILIPPYGAWGAVFATVVGYAARMVAAFAFAQSLWPVDYRFAAHLRVLVYGAIPVVGWFLVHPDGFLAQLGLSAAMLALYAALLWYGGVVSKGERAGLTAWTRVQIRTWRRGRART